MDERMNTGNNLIPEYRLNARRKRTCRRRWMVGCVGYTVFLVLVFPIASLVWVRDNSLTAQLLTVRQEVSDTEQLLKQVEDDLEDTRTTLNATKLVENQSVWSILLALLAGEVDDDIVLKKCKIEPMILDAEEKKGFASNSPLRRLAGSLASSSGSEENQRIHVESELFLIDLQGYGLTQRAVSLFVLRLERTGLFEKVTLKETRREPFMNDQAIAFQVRCYLHGENQRGGA